MDKIKYCTDDFLEEFKINFDNYFELYKTKNKIELDKIFQSPENIKDSKFEFEYKPLVLFKESNNQERDNIKIIFDSLSELKTIHAIEEKMWVAMYNTYYQDHLFDYIDRYENSKDLYTKTKASILFTHGKNRSTIIQNISRMWWLGYYLYDENNKEDPYWLLSFYTKDKDIIGRSLMFFSNAVNNNKDIRLGIIEGIKELTDMDLIKYNRKYYIDINRYFNLMGSVRLLDFMTREEIKEETINQILRNDLYT